MLTARTILNLFRGTQISLFRTYATNTKLVEITKDNKGNTIIQSLMKRFLFNNIIILQILL